VLVLLDIVRFVDHVITQAAKCWILTPRDLGSVLGNFSEIHVGRSDTVAYFSSEFFS
jgi:hypothetical protein